MKQSCQSADWIESVIKDFVETSPENSLKNPANDRAFDSPLVGFSSGDDLLYRDFKDPCRPVSLDAEGSICAGFPGSEGWSEEISAS